LTAQIGPVPILALVVLFVAVVTGLVLRATPFGLHLYALGSHRESARLSGVHIVRMRISAYVLCGIMGAFAGLLFSARIATGDPLSGQAFTLNSVTAVVIGGCALFGGRGSIAGTIAGVLILTCISNILSLVQVSSYYQYVFTGILLIGAVWLYSYLPTRRR
jgi:ribose/xylose/arabinose/galactoside ABC-type transport system permease subunit